ncbi:hypothetical protein Pst134EA_002974 [Puccinia striiformis f. sp. tritici]|uniref:Uncharacterized protein n=1 Tax=Puccinia striiformis f. sp. tritici PST-78 TaxID=1165861 RepID=A0A0L0W4A9_9BASI|nr:hypothetical protein Pst134EA_002974 [Puccinia striiformis f. sp. tritici]KAH9472352.1 hypothetical protein Pst134EA_002974 [Puccinia striiformis f. sp. tritici]KNF06346.1 hypothetical protein PSTG_00232 [Puccinia striiformis f. sp. tritici PST-78]
MGNRYLVSPGAGNPFRYQTPIRPVLAPIPGSPVWSYTTRDAVPGLDCQSSPSCSQIVCDGAPNLDSPLFRPGVPATPPGLNMSVDIPPASCMAVDDPVPVPCPFVVGEPGLANISNYLHNNPVGVNPPLAAAHVPPPVNQAPPPLPAAPAGFEPSTTALNWGQRQTSVLSSSSSALGTTSYVNPQVYPHLSNGQIHLLLENPSLTDPYARTCFNCASPIDKYFFVAISFLKYCHKHPTPNQII